MKTTHSPEPLEARISPAVFYASGASAVIKNSANLPITGDAAAATYVGVDFALLLAKGDSLYLDMDGNVTTTGDQTLMAKVTNGLGMFFLDDHGAGNFASAGFDGLAVSDEFSGSVTRDIQGDVVTALTPGGVLARTVTNILIQKADIAGLSLQNGAGVNGSILASGKISNIVGTGGSDISGSITNDPNYFTSGSGLGLNVASSEYTAPAPVAGTPGAPINGIVLDDVSEIRAAAGQAKTNAAGGAGGSVSNVFLSQSNGTSIVAGAGAVGGGSGKGGLGGSVKHVSIVSAGDDVIITAGAGGGRAGTPGTGGGGNGGLLSNINVTDSSENAYVQLSAGFGGNGFASTGPNSSGGAGGSVINSSVHLHFHGTVFVSAGGGGQAHGGAGGVGGSIAGTSIVMNDGGSIATSIGMGGFSEDGRGGAGGSYINDSVVIKGTVFQSGLGLFKAGDGGSGRVGGGAGGIVSNSSLRILGEGSSLLSFPMHFGPAELLPPPSSDLIIGGGAGGSLFGSGQTAAMKPGKGGAVVGFDVAVGIGAELPGGIVVQAGDAGSAAGGASGAAGGAISKLTIDVGGTLGAGGGFPSAGAPESEEGIVVIPIGTFAHISALGGSGSSAGTDPGSNGLGGPGGAVTGVTVNQHGDYGLDALGSVNLLAGHGGNGSGLGKGGAGGVLGSGGAPINVRAMVPLVNGVYLSGGNGGDGSLAGAGGNVNTVNLLLQEAGFQDAENNVNNAITVYGGHAGDSSTMKGVNGGSVLSLSVVATGELIGFVEIYGGNGGDAASPLKGGAGGAVQKSNITTYDSTNEMFIYGGNGGAGTMGGKGGALSNTSFTYLDFVSDTHAGGGAGGVGLNSTSTGGVGGAANGVAIRDFGQNHFNLTGGVGGTVNAGTGGVGGAVSSIKLDASQSDFDLHAGTGGNSSEGAGGIGGMVTSVTGVVGTFSATAGFGGSGTTTGGLGGSVQGINVLTTNRVDVLRAGDGGSGGPAGGAGGKVTGVVVVGDIGNFNPDPGDSGSGEFGVIVGRGGSGSTPGLNGFATGISASRISTIMAGAALSGFPTAANAALKISGVKAAVIGADADNDGIFDFTGPAPFTLGTDTPLDGFVLVKASGVTNGSFGGTLPLMLITVP